MAISMAPTFSVIIPTRDRLEYLGEAIASVLAQDLEALEVLVVNDGSFPIPVHTDARVRIFDNQSHGLNPARNLAIQNSGGRFIAFLDDDDVWTDANFLSRAAAGLEAKGGFYFADGMMRFADGRAKHFSRDATAASLAHDNTILISALCYEKKLHDSLGLFDESIPYYADWDWYLRVARAGFHFRHDESVVVDIRVHAQNMSGGDNIMKRQNDLNQMCKKHNLGNIPLKNHIDFV